MRAKCIILALLLGIPLVRASSDAGPWVSLFNGVSLEGWKSSESDRTFSTSGGEIVGSGPRAHLFYVSPEVDHDWRDFELEMDVKTSKGCNSGVYFHTRFQDSGFPDAGYQVQINNTNPYPSKTGSLYGVEDRSATPVEDNVWFKLSIRVQGKRIITKVNDAVVSDYLEPEKPVREDEVKGSVLSHGTIALQGHDKDSEVRFRNIRIRALPETK